MMMSNKAIANPGRNRRTSLKTFLDLVCRAVLLYRVAICVAEATLYDYRRSLKLIGFPLYLYVEPGYFLQCGPKRMLGILDPGQWFQHPKDERRKHQ